MGGMEITMKYWKGNTGSPKQGQFGTMNDDGFVPDSVGCTKAEYDAYVASLPVIPAPKDYVSLYAAAPTEAEKLQVIADKLGLV